MLSEENQMRFEEWADRQREMFERAMREHRDFTAAEEEEYAALRDKMGRLPNERRTFSSPRNLGNFADSAGFKDLGELMSTISNVRQGKQSYDNRLDTLHNRAKTFAMGGDGTGGFAVPSQFVAHIFAAPTESEPLLSNCDKIPMLSANCDAPLFEDSDHTTSPYGISWACHSENSAITENAVPDLSSIGLNAHTWMGLFKVSNEWLADAHPTFRQRLTDAFTRSLRWKVENLLWNGSGAAGEPTGVFADTDSLLVIDAETEQAASTIIHENLTNMWSRLRPGSHSRAIWVANQTAFPQLASMTVAGGTAATPAGILQVSGTPAAGVPSNLIFGRPLYLSEHVPALGTAGDFVLVDPMLYILGDRMMVTIDVSSDRYFEYNQTAFRIGVRFDGKPALSTTFTPNAGVACAYAVTTASRV